MIMRSSIAFEDFLGSSIAPQVMPPWIILISERVDGEPLYLITASPVEEVQRLALCDPLEREPPEEGSLLQSSTLLQLRVTVVTEVPIAELLLLAFPFCCSIGGDFLPQSPNVNHRVGLDMISKRGVWVNLVLRQLRLQVEYHH